MGLERLIRGIRTKLGITESEELRELKDHEKERNRLLKGLRKHDKNLFYLARDKPLEVVREMSYSTHPIEFCETSYWQEVEPILAVNYDLDPQSQGRLAHILRAFIGNKFNISYKNLKEQKDLFFDFYGLDSNKTLEEKRSFLKLLEGKTLAGTYYSLEDISFTERALRGLKNDNSLQTLLKLVETPEINFSSMTKYAIDFINEQSLPVSEEKKLALLQAYLGTSRDVQDTVLYPFLRMDSDYDINTTDEIVDYRLEMLNMPEWFREHMLDLSNRDVVEHYVPNKHLPEAVAFAAYANWSFRYHRRRIGEYDWFESSKVMGKILVDSSIEDPSAKFSIINGAALHEEVYQDEEKLPEIGLAIESARDIIEGYLSIEKEIEGYLSNEEDVTVEKFGLRNSPAVSAIAKRLIEESLSEEPNLEELIWSYNENIGNFAEILNVCNDLTYYQIFGIVSYIPDLQEKGIDFEKIIPMYKEGYRNQCFDDIPNLRSLVNSSRSAKRKVELLETYLTLKEEEYIGEIENVDFRNIESLLEAKLQPTRYLYDQLAESDDHSVTLKEWKATIKSFSEGKFDPENELHRNLEYTRFRRVVEHEKLRRHIKNHFTFADYLTIFEQKESADPFDEQDKFEINCVAYEARLLRDYILAVKERADELGREVIVIPNLSYGYLPVSPLVDELEETDTETIIGVKIGSTESHNNREVMNSRLFKGHRTEITNKQPIMLVVDGTYNLVTTNNRNATARYPDAHQGYLNQVIAMNDANGFTDEDYSHVGKTDEDIQRLRESPEFQRAVEVYRHVANANSQRVPYTFHLWNTAEMELAIRGEREIIANITPYDGNVRQPTMVFCNVGVLDERIPDEIRGGFEEKHKPAYFDDSGKIISFDFGYDDYGVRYLNRLETEVKSAYDKINGEEQRSLDVIPIPAIIGYAMKNPNRPIVEEVVR